MRKLLILVVALLLGGCERIAGMFDSKVADAQAVGAACRLAQQKPDECITKNPKQSPAHILAGWKKTDDDIKDGKVDPTMSNALRPKEEEKSDDEEEDKKDKDEE